jgi:hypothetical protein
MASPIASSAVSCTSHAARTGLRCTQYQHDDMLLLLLLLLVCGAL